MKRPNVVVITSHDLGDYLGCYGTPVCTPNLDGFGSQGVVFEKHFTTASVCSPARGSIVTGCYPHTNGLMGLVHRGWRLDVDKCPALPALLAKAGYETLLFGLEHEHPDPQAMGYQQVFYDGWRQCEATCGNFANWLRQRKGSDKPFFAAVGFFEVHRAFNRDVYRPADPAKVKVPPFMPDIPEVRKDLADFYGAIEWMDKAVGTILDALDETALADDTLVVFVTDHGASFIKSKATLYEGGSKVTLLMRWPKVIPAGQRCRDLTSHVDILPTIFELAGLDIPSHVQGRSFAGDIAGKPNAPAREYVFAEKNVTNYYDPTRMVRSDRMRYLRKGLQTCVFDFQIPEIEALSYNPRANPTVFEFYSARRCCEELYDVVADPGETNNLIDDPRHAKDLAKLKAALDAHLEATDDPFRHLRNDILLQADGYEYLNATRKRLNL